MEISVKKGIFRRLLDKELGQGSSTSMTSMAKNILIFLLRAEDNFKLHEKLNVATAGPSLSWYTNEAFAELGDGVQMKEFGRR